MKRNLILFSVVLFIWGCQTKSDDKAISTNKKSEVKIISSPRESLNKKNIVDFHFTAKTHKDYIDSRTGTYTRFYKADSNSVHFELTKKEQNVIQTIYFGSNLDTLPDNFIPRSMLWRTNLDSDVDFVIYFNGNKKRLQIRNYYNPYLGSTDENTQRVIDNMTGFYMYVYRVVFNKKEVMNLKSSDL